MDPVTSSASNPARTGASSGRILLAFGLGIVAGAAVMSCAGLLWLRANLITRTDFTGLTADDLDDALENEFPAGTGWHAVRETVSMPLPRDGRTLYLWKLHHRDHARALMDDPDRGTMLTALLPATVSVTGDPKDGHAIVSRLNPALLGFILGGDAGALLRSDIDREQAALLEAAADRIRTQKATRKEPEP